MYYIIKVLFVPRSNELYIQSYDNLNTFYAIFHIIFPNVPLILYSNQARKSRIEKLFKFQVNEFEAKSANIK